MLSAMRNGKYRYFFYALLGLLALGLIGFGSGGLGNGSVRSIGKVGEHDVPVNTYAQTLNATLQNTFAQYGRALSPAEIEGFRIKENVLRAVLSQSALDNEAKRLGLSVGDAAVANIIRQTPSFQGLDGKFDEETYKFALERSNVSARDNEESIRQSAARRLIERAVGSGLSNGTNQAEAFVRFANEQRDFDWVLLETAPDAAQTPDPNDAELEKFYSENEPKYTAPEARDITYAWLTPAMMEAEVEITQEELQEAYDLQSERYNTPARRIIERIVFGTDDEANDARTRLDGNAISFQALVEERGFEIEDVSLGEVTKGEIATDAADAIFGASETGIYGPFTSDLGPALYRVNAVLDAEFTSFEDAKEELRAEMVGDSAARLVADLYDDFNDQLAAGATLEELAADTQMQLGTIAYTPDSEEPIAGYKEFRDAALAAQTSDYPEILDLSDGGVFAMRLNKIVEPQLKPLETIKDIVIADWQDAQEQANLKKQADEYVVALNAGGNFTSLGLSATAASNITRGSVISDLPPSVTLGMFDIEANKAKTFEVEGEIYLAQLKNITPVDIETEESQQLISQLSQQLSTQTATDMLELFAQALQKEVGVTLNTAAINSIDSQIISGQ